MEKLNSHVAALSLGFTTTVLYAVCLAIIAITPVPVIVSFVNSLQYGIDVSGIVTRNYSISGILIGIIGWFIIAAVTGYIFSFIYNWIGNKLS